MSLLDKLKDFIMPVQEEEEFEEEFEEKAIEKKPEPVVEKKIEVKSDTEKKIDVAETSEIKVANGGSIPISETVTPFPTLPTNFQSSTKTQLRNVKTPELTVKVYLPLRYDDTIRHAADDLLSKCAVVVNYEQSDTFTQQRISDFLGGVCYIKDGSTRKISDKIILYAPVEVDTEEALSAAMS